MDEHKAHRAIHDAVLGSLMWLDRLPSQENEILRKSAKAQATLMSARGPGNSDMIDPASAPSVYRSHHHRLRPTLLFCAVMILVAGIWKASQIGHWDQLSSIGVTTGAHDHHPASGQQGQQAFLPTAARPAAEKQIQPLDRIDLYIDPALLWDEETGILAGSEEAGATGGSLPFNNAVYREVYDSGIRAEGELICRNASGTVLFKDRISLGLGGDLLSLDMPQKSFHIEALDGAFEYPIFEDRTAAAYPSLLLRNSGNDCLFTRVADGVQNRLIEKYTDIHLLTLAWKPAEVYLNNEYWGIYNLRESMDAHTICRYEGIPDDMAESVTLLQFSGHAEQGSSAGYETLLTNMLRCDPAKDPDDRTYLEQEIDIDSFLDWLAVEMYFGNTDIGTGRIYQIPGGKWKCLIQDLDYGLFMSNDESMVSYLTNDGTGTNMIFRRILEVDQYKKLFLAKMEMLFKHLTTEIMQKELDECVARIEPGMRAHLERWAPYNHAITVSDAPSDPVEAWDHWKQRIDRMRNRTMAKRPYYVSLQLQALFGLTDQETADLFSY